METCIDETKLEKLLASILRVKTRIDTDLNELMGLQESGYTHQSSWRMRYLEHDLMSQRRFLRGYQYQLKSIGQ